METLNDLIDHIDKR